VIVSSLLLQRDGGTTHSVEDYLRRFDHLVDLGIPIYFFADRAISLPRYPWYVHVERIRLSETKIFRWLETKVNELPAARNEAKDTFDYLALMNAKGEFLQRVLSETTATRLTWVDAGIAHILKSKETLKHLHDVHRLPSGIVIPGTRPAASLTYSPVPLDRIHWRFCGGFLSGDRESLLNFTEAWSAALLALSPRLLWEVNVWAWMEQQGFPIQWYYGDHNDSMFDFRSLLRPL
jgi:hypothetical protein